MKFLTVGFPENHSWHQRRQFDILRRNVQRANRGRDFETIVENFQHRPDFNQTDILADKSVKNEFEDQPRRIGADKARVVRPDSNVVVPLVVDASNIIKSSN